MIVLFIFIVVVSAQPWHLVDPDDAPYLTTDPSAKPPLATTGACIWHVGESLYLLDSYLWKYELQTKRWLWLDKTPFTEIQQGACWYSHDLMWYHAKDTWSYNRETRQWKKYNSVTLGYRYGAAFWNHEYSNRLFLYGGSNNITHLSDLWAFDVLSMTWNQIQNNGAGPGPAFGVAAVPGRDENYIYLYNNDRIWELSMHSMEWRQMGASGPQGPNRADFAFLRTSAEIVLYGGRSGSKIFGDVWSFDAPNDVWIPRGANSGPGMRHSMGFCGPYIIGGNEKHNDIWSYGINAEDSTNVLNQLDLPATIVSAIFSVLCFVLLLLGAIIALCRRKRKHQTLVNPNEML